MSGDLLARLRWMAGDLSLHARERETVAEALAHIERADAAMRGLIRIHAVTHDGTEVRECMCGACYRARAALLPEREARDE